VSNLLTPNENEAASEFVWEHYRRRCGGEKDASLELKAAATGVGFSITIRCPNCKESRNITNTESW